MTEAQTILIKQAKVIDPQSTHHLNVCDIFIENDQIKAIGDSLNIQAELVIEQTGLHISPGWFDLRANFRDPGTGDAEDFNSGASAAIAGGFTGVGLSPETDPVIDRKSDVEYLYKCAEELPLHVYPLAAFSQKLAGQELSEMWDLHEAGAASFSHGQRNLKNTALLKLALLYGREFAPHLHLQAFDANIRGNGVMHEGAQSTWLGLKGIPALAEELGVLQALHIADYAETGIHFQGISAASTVAILKEARALKDRFSADVNLANLVFTDEDLQEYNTNLKVYPPLRSKGDQEALIRGLAEGTLEVITSNHEPHELEAKRCEFEQAAFGAAGLETFFGALWKRLESEMELSRVIECIAHNPRKVLALDIPHIEEGTYAEFTLFNPHKEYSLSQQDLESKAANNPYLNLPLKGKAVATLVKGTVVLL